MCLSNVYTLSDGVETLVCEYVSDIKLDGGDVVLTDVMGQQKTVTGTLVNVDLIQNKIMIVPA